MKTSVTKLAGCGVQSAGLTWQVVVAVVSRVSCNGTTLIYEACVPILSYKPVSAGLDYSV